jgi:signal transduction histidine kinase
MRVLLMLITINALVAAVTLGFAARRSALNSQSTAKIYERDALLLAGDLVDTVASQTQNGQLNVGPILSWPHWKEFSDAILLDDNLPLVNGRVIPSGRALNPVGRSRRSANLNHQLVYAGIRNAIHTGEAIDDVEDGRVVPITLEGRPWGGCWYKIENPPVPTDFVLTYFLPAFLLSTLLLSAGTFFALRRFVLDPVAQLARGARQVEAGDFSVRIPEPATRDEIAELVGVFNSMTERVQGFNAHLAAEVERATQQARRAEAAAMTQRRLAAMGELAAGIAHEINNPLGGLLNAVETLERGSVDEAKRKRYLELLSGGLERIGRIVGQLLRFTPRRTRPELMSLVGPVKDAIDLVRHRAERAQVELVLCNAREPVSPEQWERAFADLPPVLGEVGEFGQAVLNLLVNALDALEGRPANRTEPARIEVRLSHAGGQVALEVCDNGPGVDAAQLERLADLFYTTKEVGKGTGLGLSIVHQVIASHGGRLELSSPPGGGFKVTIHVPAARDDTGSRRELP